MPNLEQILPPLDNLRAEDFDCHNVTFHAQLAQQGNNPLWYSHAFNPYPLAVDDQGYKEQLALQKALYATIKSVVGNYFHDIRLRKLIAIPVEAEQLLRSIDAAEPAYEPGSYRPDYLIDRQSAMQICEINARFPLNGYLITAYLNQCAEQLPYLTPWEGSSKSLPCLTLEAFMSRCHGRDKIYILKEREKGWDIHFLNFELKHSGRDVKQLDGARLHNIDVNSLRGSGFILELHQHELLEKKTLAKIAELAKVVPQKYWLNDLRTIFLIHDKRFLALFQRPDILSDYITNEQINLLGRHVARTFVLALSPQQVAEAKAEREKWLLKPNLLGKGEGILFGANLSAREWCTVLENPDFGEYILQEKIEQRQLSIWQAKRNSRAALTELNVVGTLLCLDDKFLGPGLFRASPGEIVNVAGGGTILMPYLV